MENKIRTIIRSFVRMFETKQARQDRLRLERIYERLSKFPAGRELLDVKDRLKVKVRFSRKLPPKTRGDFSPSSRVIRLSASRSDTDVISSLAHEVRHAWQLDVLGVGNIIHSPRVQANFMRMIEGDAFSFQDVFMYRLQSFEENGVETNAQVKELRFGLFIITQDYLDNYEARAVKKTLRLIFDRADAQNPILKACLRFSAFLYSPWGGSFSSKANLQNLRKICTVGFDPAGDNYLADMSHAQLQKALQQNSHPDLTRANIKKTGHGMAALRKVFHEARQRKPGIVRKLWYKASNQPIGPTPR